METNKFFSFLFINLIYSTGKNYTVLWKKWLTKGVVLEDILSNPEQNNFNFIRLLAALVVISVHCFDFKSYTYLKYIGALGVPAFFFLSGLLVSASFYRRRSLRNFIWRRVLRIYPAAIVVILFCALILGPILTTLSLKEYFSDTLLYRYISSIFLVQMNFNLPGVLQNSLLHTSSINVSLWSLTLELKMYLFLGIWCIINFFYKEIWLILLSLISIYAGIFYSEELQSLIRIFFHNFLIFPYISAVPMFLLGMICYNYKRHIIIRHYWVFVFVPLFILAVNFNFITYILHLLLAIVLLYTSAFGKRYISYFMPKADYSYGLYVYAFPVEQIVANYIVLSRYGYKLFLITILLTFPLAFLSWHLIEKRALSHKNG